MKHLIRYKYHVLVIAILVAILFAGVRTTVTEITDTSLTLPRIQTHGQLDHALELLPRNEHASVLSVGADEDQRALILSLVESSLSVSNRDRAYEIARAVIVEANHHGMDPLFLLAVIQTESQFNLKARGRHGEIGLMQILPKTAAWLAPQAGIEVAKINLEDPSQNIRLGATYFALLRKNFSGHGSRYVAAYNMGSLNVRRLVRKNIEPYIYSGKVMANYKSIYGQMDQVERAVASAE